MPVNQFCTETFRYVRVFFLTCCLLIAACAATSNALAQGPLDALTQAQKAIDDCDYAMFQQTADIDSIIKTSTDIAIKGLKEQLDHGGIPGANPAITLLLSSIDFNDIQKFAVIEALLTSEVKSFVANGITGGYFAGKPNKKAKSTSPLLQGLSKGRKEIVPGKVLKETADTATVTATFIDHGMGKFPLELDMVKTNNTWRVVRLNNAEQLIRNAIRPID